MEQLDTSVPHSADWDNKDYARGAFMSLKLFLIEAFEEIIEWFAKRLFNYKEGWSTSNHDFDCGKLLNKLTMQLVKILDRSKGESIVATLCSLLQSHGKALQKISSLTSWTYIVVR